MSDTGLYFLYQTSSVHCSPRSAHGITTHICLWSKPEAILDSFLSQTSSLCLPLGPHLPTPVPQTHYGPGPPPAFQTPQLPPIVEPFNLSSVGDLLPSNLCIAGLSNRSDLLENNFLKIGRAHV